MELRDDSKTTFFEAIGLSTYSNSRAGRMATSLEDVILLVDMF
jgi:hypothetical protein